MGDDDATTSSTTTLYGLLGAERWYSHGELRRCYYDKARELHPDKANSGDRKHENVSKFQEIQHAWDVLGDEKKRAEYDQSLEVNDLKTFMATEIDLDDMDYDEENNLFSYDCRCGDQLIVSESALESNLEIFECASCSVLYKVNYEKLE